MREKGKKRAAETFSFPFPKFQGCINEVPFPSSRILLFLRKAICFSILLAFLLPLPLPHAQFSVLLFLLFRVSPPSARRPFLLFFFLFLLPPHSCGPIITSFHPSPLLITQGQTARQKKFSPAKPPRFPYAEERGEKVHLTPGTFRAIIFEFFSLVRHRASSCAKTRYAQKFKKIRLFFSSKTGRTRPASSAR